MNKISSLLTCTVFACILPLSVSSDIGGTDELKDTAKTQFFGALSDMVSGLSESLESEQIKYADLSLVEEDWIVGGQITAVIGLSEAENTVKFTQLSASHLDGRTTANIGIGVRTIPDGWEAIIGANAFVDAELSSGHQRIGIGAEYLSLSGSIRVNHYQGISDEKTYKGVREKALDGTDVKLSYQLELPASPEVFYRAFEWKGDNSYKVKGREAGARLTLSEHLILQVSNKDDDKSKSENKAELSYLLPLGTSDKSRAAEIGVNEGSTARAQLRQMLYKPVQRENRIRKSQIRLGVVMSSY